MLTIDADQHIFEPHDMWRSYIDPAWRDSALAIEDDAIGYPWLTWQGRQLYPIELQEPRATKRIGEERLRQQRGEPPSVRYDDALPASYYDPAARVAALDQFGLDASVLFPNFGLLWEDMLGDDVGSLCANLRAHNRWQADLGATNSARLFPVAHLSLRDPRWAVEEVARLAGAGVRLAMLAPSPVDGKALSHNDFDPFWAACCTHGITPVFHVGGFSGPLHPAWYAGDPEPVDRLMDSVFLYVAPAVALANLILLGTLDRFPELRLGVVELTAGWVPSFLLTLDGASDFYADRHGGPLRQLSLRPSEYFLRQVRVSALAYENPAALVASVGSDVFMFGSDWPHAEGIPRPRADYEAMTKGLDDRQRAALMGESVAWLLRQDR